MAQECPQLNEFLGQYSWHCGFCLIDDDDPDADRPITMPLLSGINGANC